MAIINPWIFYLIEVLKGLKEVSVVAIFMTIIMLICIGIATLWLRSEDSFYRSDNNASTIKACIRAFKKLSIVACIITSVYVVTPSEETMYKMLVAQYVTYENVDKATESIKEGVDYIFKKLNKEDKKDE